MDEYIKRNSLFEKMQERDLCLCVSESDIMDTPAEDVAPVVHGRWLKNERFKQKRRKCSECGFDSDFEFNFCPNCGARMDAEYVEK